MNKDSIFSRILIDTDGKSTVLKNPKIKVYSIISGKNYSKNINSAAYMNNGLNSQ